MVKLMQNLESGKVEQFIDYSFRPDGENEMLEPDIKPMLIVVYIGVAI